MRLLALLFCWLYVFQPSSDRAEQREAKTEQHWAKQVAMDFLNAATSKYSSGAKGLLSPELAKALESDKNLLEALSDVYTRPEITSEEPSPSGSEIRFSGLVKGDPDRGWSDANFTLRVARDRNDGRWYIRYISIMPRP